MSQSLVPRLLLGYSYKVDLRYNRQLTWRNIAVNDNVNTEPLDDVNNVVGMDYIYIDDKKQLSWFAHNLQLVMADGLGCS